MSRRNLTFSGSLDLDKVFQMPYASGKVIVLHYVDNALIQLFKHKCRGGCSTFFSWHYRPSQIKTLDPYLLGKSIKSWTQWYYLVLLNCFFSLEPLLSPDAKICPTNSQNVMLQDVTGYWKNLKRKAFQVSLFVSAMTSLNIFLWI